MNTFQRMGKRVLAGACLLGGLLGFSSAQGAGLLIAEGGFGGRLEIVEQDVKVTVNNGVAVTRVTQVFRNLEKRQVEALYTFPVPKGASVANFSMWIAGKEVIGEVLEKQRAREIYESYKVTRQDPGLLEQVDYKTFEMRIFPIGAEAEQRVEITYYQELEFDNDWATYVYPLATTTRAQADSRVSGRFAIDFEIKSAVPLAAVESPSHPDDFAVAQHASHYVQASLEAASGDLARDVVLACRFERPLTGVDLIANRVEGEDGYFSLTLTAGSEDLGKLATGMDYVFVLDISGSMQVDRKLETSTESIAAFIKALGEDDRFEVMSFNVQANPLFRELKAANAEHLSQASAFLRSQQARGGTVLNPALNAAYRYRDDDRPLNVVVLSDGLTEQRERAALLQLIRTRPANTRVFCIGVGNEVNRPLLEQVAQDSGGLAAFLSAGDSFARQARAFRRKLTAPAIANVRVAFAGGDVYAVDPAAPADLFHGSPIRLYGRYRKPGMHTVRVTGELAGRTFSREAVLEFPAADDSNPEIERMWAWKRIDQLLKNADRDNRRDDVLPEVIELGETYSIVTEYTSFLVLENDAEYRRWKIDRRNMRRMDRDRGAQENVRRTLDELRNRSIDGIGPEAVAPAPVETTASTPARPASSRGTPVQRPAPSTSAPAPANRGADFTFGTGSAPVGPLFVVLAACLALQRKRSRR